MFEKLGMCVCVCVWVGGSVGRWVGGCVCTNFQAKRTVLTFFGPILTKNKFRF